MCKHLLKIVTLICTWDCGLDLCCWCAEFPPETEDAFNFEQYDNTVQMLSVPTEKKTGASADDGEVKIGANKRKAVATSEQNKKDKVCTS